MDPIFIVTPGDLLSAVFFVLFWIFAVVVSTVYAGSKLVTWWKRRR
jgi:hypothetical protein